MKYLVDIKDTSYATVEVESHSRSRLKRSRYARYYEGTVDGWTAYIEVKQEKLKKSR